ncbi:MAG: hypothetical protein HOP07_10795 [Bacteriovoracaceae bacterium]|nr:hypothetical protein [Bacteriovoracaceae bacterium]
MKIFICVFSFILSTFAFADDVDVVIEPKEPIVNESFYVTFKLKTSSSEDPYISFTPYGVTVLGKRSQGLSISTVVINGKFTTTKEQAVVYELIAERAGQVYLRNIKVELDGKTIPVKELRISVLNEARKVPDAFIEAEASKTKVYLGEGIDVNYYLYFKNSISANDVKEFPKLNKFIKRFHHINSPIESVQYKGQVLRRILAYSARLYPEKIGLASLDPMKISVQIPESDYNGFGFGSQRYKNKDLSSPRIEIEVLPLPSEGVPASFTGLVGEHDFILSAPKSRYLINEPIEIKLEVKGKGAVENLDAPVIFSDKNLEQFDTKSEVAELGFQAAKKVFEYTLLARGPVKLEARELELAYFDPSTTKYVVKKVSVPALFVDGTAAVGPTKEEAVEANPEPNSTNKENLLNSFFNKNANSPIQATGLVSPTLRGDENWLKSGFAVFNWVTSLLITILCISWIYTSRSSNSVNSKKSLIEKEIQTLKKKGMNYSNLYQALSHLDKFNKMSQGGVSIINIVEESELPSPSKEYFSKSLKALEGVTFGANQSGPAKLPTFERKHFKELLKSL